MPDETKISAIKIEELHRRGGAGSRYTTRPTDVFGGGRDTTRDAISGGERIFWVAGGAPYTLNNSAGSIVTLKTSPVKSRRCFLSH